MFMPNLINFMSFIISASLCSPLSLSVSLSLCLFGVLGISHGIEASSTAPGGLCSPKSSGQATPHTSPFSLATHSTQQTKLNGKCQIRQKIRKAQNKLGSKLAMGSRVTVSSANAKVTENVLINLRMFMPAPNSFRHNNIVYICGIVCQPFHPLKTKRQEEHGNKYKLYFLAAFKLFGEY